MKITLEQLRKDEACKEGILDFQKLNLQKINWDEIKEITTNFLYYKNSLQWLFNNYKVTNNLILTYTNSNGDWEKLKYNNLGQITDFNISDNYWERYHYNEKGLLTKKEHSDLHWKEYKYNDKGLMTESKNSYKYWRKYYYNDMGLKIKYEDSNKYGETWEYNASGLLL